MAKGEECDGDIRTDGTYLASPVKHESGLTLMRDGAVIDLGPDPVKEAETLVIKAVDEVMKEPRLLWLNDLPIDAKIHLAEAYRKLEYARFYQSGQKLKEGELRLP